MVIYNPNDYTKKGFSHDADFFGDMGKSLGFSSKFSTVQPFNANIDFVVNPGQDFYFDIGNVNYGNIVAGNVNVKSFFVGSLYARFYVTGAGAGSGSFWLTTGGPLTTSPSFNNFLVAAIDTAAVDVVINNDDAYSFESVAFSLLHLGSVGAGQIKVEALFTGVRVSF